jgi:predicted TIM-barrel fold metal-dependent hydrolase
MNVRSLGAIDCDVHPQLPSLKALIPYMNDHWRESILQRGIHELTSISYPENSPLTVRPDWRPQGEKAASRFELIQKDVLDPFGESHAILNCLYGVQLLFSEDMAAAFTSALNTWIAREWLDRDPRLRASIVVPMQNPQMAAEEIERWAGDKRFVQVLLLVMDQMPLGKRYYWPIYEAAQKHGLTVGIHAGSSYRYPVTAVGWPSLYSEDYAAQSPAFQSALTSLICEGVFSKYPSLKVAMLESGFTWLPAHLWRLDKYWRGLRMEIPWVDRSPTDIVKTNIRFSLQPADAPPTEADFGKLMDHMGSDELLLFSTDYPHWQFDGDDVMPTGLSADLVRKIAVDNPLATYPRLKETVQ